MGAEIELQAALNAALTALPLRVYDAAPQAKDGGASGEFPYVEIGQIILSDFDDKSVNGFEFVARIHTRSRSGSMAEAKGIQGQIRSRLHNGDLTVVGQRLIMMRREKSFVDRASDGSFHGVCEYRGLIEAT